MDEAPASPIELAPSTSFWSTVLEATMWATTWASSASRCLLLHLSSCEFNACSSVTPTFDNSLITASSAGPGAAFFMLVRFSREVGDEQLRKDLVEGVLVVLLGVSSFSVRWIHSIDEAVTAT